MTDQTAEHNYPVYIAIWSAVSLLTLFIFKTVPKKMKLVKDKETKSSLFTIIIFAGLPLLLVSVLTPLVFIIGDRNMEYQYKAIWAGLIVLFLMYFFMKQKSNK